MVEKQKEAQQEMASVQFNNQLKMQERMRRMMVAQQMAMTRERLVWFEGVLGVATTGALIGSIKHKTAAPWVPVFLLGVITAYQWDFAYGTKAERINVMYEDIIQDPSFWFTPVLPNKEIIQKNEQLETSVKK
uniref:Plasminogen receptor (KT) n=1 Tax=Arcella intermedia TaxID=1963864 RepID=A0A6B2LQW0_9EUKA|eukprot:TRINITY_DN1002_c0_g1_i1.p1 TRINITY_DN1002_c0_g1~~TRINITY_DN1002_c0_g1_i1.p1  ORF type:complete len:150 (+),score=42.81 TRINITY_DN1002_c0_g1_i1:54-452(+)